MLIKRKEFSSKMSDEEFDEREKKVIKKYKKGLGHTVGAAINGYIAKDFIKGAIKSKGKSKLNNIGAVITTGNSAYHTYKAGSNFRKGLKEGRNKEYQKKLQEVLDREDEE